MVDEDKAWLDSLKVGDKVIVRRYGRLESEYTIAKVKHITPSRNRFDIQTPYSILKFGQWGQERGSGYDGALIIPYTQELVAEIRLKIRRSKISAFDMKTLTPVQVDVIFDILFPAMELMETKAEVPPKEVA